MQPWHVCHGWVASAPFDFVEAQRAQIEPDYPKCEMLVDKICHEGTQCALAERKWRYSFMSLQNDIKREQPDWYDVIVAEERPAAGRF